MDIRKSSSILVRHAHTESLRDKRASSGFLSRKCSGPVKPENDSHKE